MHAQIVSAIKSASQELELILKVSSIVSEAIGAEKVNFLINQNLEQNYFTGKPGILLPIEETDGLIKNGWQIFEREGRKIQWTDALRAELAAAGQLLALGLENLYLKQETIVDGLTRLYNRAHFDRCLTHEMERSKRYGTPFSLLMVDVDKFKSFNDSYGHQAGDEVLKIVAKVLRDNTRASDMIFRYGGEEFAILLPHGSQKKAEILAGRVRMHVDATVGAAERLRESISQQLLKHGDKTLQITVSIGLSTFAGTEQDMTVADIIKKADDALYRAKDLGRNRSEVLGKEERLRILIVDDDEAYCNLLTEYFESRDYEVSSTASGRVAIELMNNNVFHLVLLDLKMAGVSGMEVLQRIKKPSKQKKIVVLTGMHDQTMKQLCFDYGACEYLEKPISIEYIAKNLMARILEMKA